MTEESFSTEGSALKAFIENYYFDMDFFFRSVTFPNDAVYLYCGDVQKNTYYISDNLREEFGFESNIVYDFIRLLERRIHEDDRSGHQKDMRDMLESKNSFHSIRYRIYNKNGECCWMHCHGIMKWNKDCTIPLFFSGIMMRISEAEKKDFDTGLYNRKNALKTVEELISAQKKFCIFAFILSDLHDGDKRVDSEMRKNFYWQVGYNLKTKLGEKYIFFHLDGLYFLAVSESIFSAETAARQLWHVLADTYQSLGIYPGCPCTVGAVKSSGSGPQAGILIDQAVIAAKAAGEGKGKVFLEYSDQVCTEYRRNSELKEALYDSVANDFVGFRIVIQPQVKTVEGKICGGEVLLRWQKDGKDIPPSVFIPLLEQMNLIIPVGKWILIQAAKACGDILPVRPDFRLSVNISYLQVLEDDFFPFICSTLQEYGTPGENLIFELTESHINALPDRLQTFISNCSDVGIAFALDDFGTAYSSLSLLIRYPVELVKIDRGIMMEIMASDRNLKFLAGVIYACHQLACRVCVEGVETDQEWRLICRTGCDLLQGYYFYPPMELEDAYAVLKKEAEENIED